MIQTITKYWEVDKVVRAKRNTEFNFKGRDKSYTIQVFYQDRKYLINTGFKCVAKIEVLNYLKDYMEKAGFKEKDIKAIDNLTLSWELNNKFKVWTKVTLKNTPNLRWTVNGYSTFNGVTKYSVNGHWFLEEEIEASKSNI